MFLKWWQAIGMASLKLCPRFCAWDLKPVRTVARGSAAAR